MSARPLRKRDASRESRLIGELFDSASLDEFWRFVYERQAIYQRRFQEKSPPPWTDDQILRSFHFTNVYRELDPGTKYARESILERDAPEPDRVFNVMMYRLIGSMDTHAQLGFQYLSEFDFRNFEGKLKHIREVGKKPPFTGAYTVSAYMKMGSRDKIENVSRLFRDLQKTFSKFYDRLKNASSPEEAFSVIDSVYGYGTFLAFQVLVDLTYPIARLGGTKVLPFSQDEWAVAGPGAISGIRLLVSEPRKADELDVMRWLWRNQETEFARLKLPFSYMIENSSIIRISLSNIENCLCEYYKYMNVKTGRGRIRRRFIPRQAHPIQPPDLQGSLGSYRS